MCYMYFYFVCLHCCLTKIHIFDYVDSGLSELFTQVPPSLDNRGSSAHDMLYMYKTFFFAVVVPV